MKRLSYIFILLLFATCTKKSDKEYLLNLVKNEHTGITFENEIKDDSKYNIVNYLYYYNGGGLAVGDINNDELPDIYFVSNKGDNRLYLNKGGLQFEDITSSAQVAGNSDWNTGVTMIDINNDSYLDIYVCSVTGLLDFKGKNELFINNGDGTFTEKAHAYGLDYKGYSTQSYFFDYDKDDDLDVYIVNHAVHTKSSHGPALIRKKRIGLVGDVLLKNENGKFIDASEEANIFGGVNGYGLSASIADFNNDGWDDIYVCNDFHEDDYYYLNNQDGTFSESLSNSFSTISRFTMGSDAADIDGDGYQDLITLDMLPYDEKVLKESEGDVNYNTQSLLTKKGYYKQYSRNMLQLNKGGTFFSEVGLFNNIAATDWSWAPLIADFDQDGHQDVFVSNGIYKRPNNLDFMKYISSSFKKKSRDKNSKDWLLNSLKEMPEGKVSNQIFQGNSTQFINRTSQWIEKKPSLSNGAVYADLDLDGDLDIITNNLNEPVSIYENNTNLSKNYLVIELNYKKNNKNGIGSKAIVYSKTGVQKKQLFVSRGFISSIESKLHFGLKNDNKIDSVQIIWPDNTYQTVKNINVNQKLEIHYTKDNPYKLYKSRNNKEIFKKLNLIDFLHQEDNYNDFDNQKLIPYKISTAGPASAIFDLNQDDIDDIFMGNASGKKAVLYLSKGDGYVKSKKINEIENDSIYEDIDAAFIDIDNDNDMDLYVVSGINNEENVKFQNDRLYINDGKGSFTKSLENIPTIKFNGSCVKPNDYDNDGDIDLFVGNRSANKSFGERVKSYILKNDGKGKFSIDTNFELNSAVTDATWVNLNDDKLKDLIISTEWDSPKIFINTSGELNLYKLSEKLNGLWQTIMHYDIDYDGDQDIVLGNWGLNSKFKATKESPLLMYFSDFDSNGKYESIITQKVGDKEYYPVNSKDELASQMNFISKKFTTYKSFSEQPMEDIFSTELLSMAKKYEVHTLASGYLLNDKGSFNDFVEFPSPFQQSPIMSFLKVNLSKGEQLLSAGNFYDSNTYQGIFSSHNGFIIFKDSIKNNFSYTDMIEKDVISNKFQARKLHLLNLKNSKALLIVNNNDSVNMYRLK